MGTGPFPVVKNGRGVTLTPHPLLVPWSRKSIAIPLLPLWAVRTVQSLSACTRVRFTFFIGEYPTHPAQIPYIPSMSLVTGTEQYEIWFMSLVWRPRIFKWLLDFW